MKINKIDKKVLYTDDISVIKGTISMRYKCETF